MFGKLLGSREMIDPNSYESNLFPSPSHYPAFRPTGYMLLFLILLFMRSIRSSKPNDYSYNRRMG